MNLKLTALLNVRSLRAKAIWVSVLMLVAILFVAKTSWDVSHAFRATSQVKQLNPKSDMAIKGQWFLMSSDT